MNEKQPFAESVLQKPFFWMIIAISSLSTFAFYATYVEAIIPQFLVTDPTIRNLITGAIGVLLLEGAAVAWQQILHFRTLRTTRQLDYADKASKSALYMSIGISLTYLVLSTSLISDERIINIAGVAGLLIIIAATGLQFWFAYHYSHESMMALERRQDAAAAAAVTDEYWKLRSAYAKTNAAAMAKAAWDSNQQITANDILSRLTIGGTPGAPGGTGGTPATPAASFASDAPAPAPASATKRAKAPRPS